MDGCKEKLNACAILPLTCRQFSIYCESSYVQNRRQKVVKKGALHLCAGALRSCKGGLTFKFDKNSTNL